MKPVNVSILIAALTVVACANDSGEVASFKRWVLTEVGVVCDGVTDYSGACYPFCQTDTDCDLGEVCRSAYLRTGEQVLICALDPQAATMYDEVTPSEGPSRDIQDQPSPAFDSGISGGSENPAEVENDTVGVCPDGVTFTGQIGDVTPPNGGRFTLEPYASSVDAGIAAVQSQVPDMHGEVCNPETPLTIIGAVVVAPDYLSQNNISRSQTTFWIADANGAIMVRLYHEALTEEDVPPFAIRVGQTISFNVTALSRYYSSRQIQAGSDWTLNATGHPVSVWEPDRVLMEHDVSRMVRITGSLTGPGERCGGDYRCWQVSYGADGGEPLGTAILRTNSVLADTGACLTFVGPLHWYQDEPMLMVTNFSWIFVY